VRSIIRVREAGMDHDPKVGSVLGAHRQPSFILVYNGSSGPTPTKNHGSEAGHKQLQERVACRSIQTRGRLRGGDSVEFRLR
jgi:hypothetical protein